MKGFVNLTHTNNGKIKKLEQSIVSVDDKASLTEENTFIGKQNFNGEIEVNSGATFNQGATLADSTLKVLDTTNDTATTYKADSIEIEQGEGDSQTIATVTLPKKTGTLVVDKDIENVAKKDTNNNFTTAQTINGTLTVNGDIVQNGSSYETHAEQVYTKNDEIITRDGAVGGLGAGELTGIKAKKYDGTNDGQLGFDANGVARVGDVNDTQPLLTRAESSDLTDGQALVWDATNQRAVGGTAGEPIAEAIRDNTTQIADKNGIFKAGNANPNSQGVAIGNEAIARINGVAIGYNARAYGGEAGSARGVAIGSIAQSANTDAIAIQGKALGVRSISIGRKATASVNEAIQLGSGTNNTANSFQIKDDNIYKHDTHTLTVQNAQVNGNNIYGVLQGLEEPTSETVGAVSQFYLNKSDKKLYQCMSITTDEATNTTTYEWKEIGGGAGLTDTITLKSGTENSQVSIQAKNDGASNAMSFSYTAEEDGATGSSFNSTIIASGQITDTKGIEDNNFITSINSNIYKGTAQLLLESGEGENNASIQLATSSYKTPASDDIAVIGVSNINGSIGLYCTDKAGIVTDDGKLRIKSKDDTAWKEILQGEISTTATANSIVERTQDAAIKSTPIIDIDIENQTDDTVATKKDLTDVKSKIPTTLSSLTEDSTHRTVTDTEKETWNNKASTSDIDNKLTTNQFNIYVGTADACSNANGDFGHCTQIYNKDGTFYTERKFLLNKDDFVQEGDDASKKYSLASDVMRTSAITGETGTATDKVISQKGATDNFVPKKTAPDGVLKAYTLLGDKSDDVCQISMLGDAGSITRYNYQGQVCVTVDPTNDDHLTRKKYVDDNKLDKTGGTITGTIIFNHTGTDMQWVLLKDTQGENIIQVSAKPEILILIGNKSASLKLYGSQSHIQYNNNYVLMPNDLCGFIMPYAGSSTPSGWLLCDGSAISRTTYADLFAKISTTYGAGDGSTTFNLPNLIDKFIQGSNTAGIEKTAGLPNITGSHNIIFGTIESSSGAFTHSQFYSKGYGSSSGNNSANISFDASKSNSIYGASDTVQPPALTMRYYIHY